MKVERLFMHINWHDKKFKAIPTNTGRFIRWTPQLQEICDRDEVMKVEYCVCPICGEADAIYDSWDNLNDFCGRCGQRLMKGE